MTNPLADLTETSPVHIDIPNLEEAKQALDAHQVRRPEPGTHEFTIWCDEKRRLTTRLEMAENAKLSGWSEPFVLPEKPLPPSPPPIPEIHMPHSAPSTISPEEQLDNLLAKLSNATKDAVTALDKKLFQRALSQIYGFRYQVKQITEQYGLESPVLPDIPANPWSKVVKPKSREQAPRASLPQPESIQPEALKDQPGDPVATSIAEVRRSIWLLMAGLERMTVQARAALVDELALLDAAAHAAHSLATGKLEGA